MTTRSARPAMAQQAFDLSSLLIWLQILSLFADSLRNGAGRFLDFLIFFAGR